MTMELRMLGRSGLQVTALCLGTMTFGTESDEAESRQVLDRYLDAGGTLVDTADVYSGGASEEILGRLLAGRRHQVILATKGGMARSDDPNDRGASRRHLTEALDASLRRLQTDWIDLYQLHWPDPSVAPEETVSTLDGFVRAGKVREVGVSNYLGSHLATAAALCDRHGWAPVVSLQPQYSLVSREIELEILPLCRQLGIGVLPWSPLGGGVLTGKYRAGQDPSAGTRMAESEFQANRRMTERNLEIATVVSKLAAELGRSPAQVALNWVLHRPGVTSVVLGARNVAQLDDNLGVLGWSLEPDAVHKLDQVSDTPLPYPHDGFRRLGFEHPLRMP
jgi:aryl-alcohol dehydrogenase-like predicted oxidoreductase